MLTAEGQTSPRTVDGANFDKDETMKVSSTATFPEPERAAPATKLADRMAP